MGEPLASIEHIKAGYGQQTVVHDASIKVMPGEIVGLVGHNGAGKTTFLRAAMGLIACRGGDVKVRGRSVLSEAGHSRVRSGIGYVPDGRQIFANLSVAQNLKLARGFTASKVSAGSSRSSDSDQLRKLFPIIGERQKQLAGLMSGGEQQMLSIAMALASEPDLIILDEPSIGLSPVVAERVLDVVAKLRDQMGVGILIVEQNVRRLIELADRVEVMKLGRTVGAIDQGQVSDADLWSLF